MRNLQNDTTKLKSTARPSKDGLSTETDTFKRDIQLLEKVILKELQEKPISAGNLLALLLAEQSALIERLTPYWQRREVMRAIRSVRQELGRQENEADQYLLPGFETFPKRITIGKKRQHVASAEYPEALKCLDALQQQQKRDDRRIAQMRQLLTLMEKYVRDEPHITVREVCEREQG